MTEALYLSIYIWNPFTHTGILKKTQISNFYIFQTLLKLIKLTELWNSWPNISCRQIRLKWREIQRILKNKMWSKFFFDLSSDSNHMSDELTCEFLISHNDNVKNGLLTILLKSYCSLLNMFLYPFQSYILNSSLWMK